MKLKKRKKMTKMDQIISGDSSDITIKNLPASQTKVLKMLQKMGWKGRGIFYFNF